MINSRSKRGFTLIELMIVVVIIGLLAAIAIGRYSKAARRSKLTEAKIVLKSIWTCCQIYYQNYGDYPLNRKDIGRDGYPEIAFDPVSGISRFNYELKEEKHGEDFVIKAKCKKKKEEGYDATIEKLEMRCNKAGEIWIEKDG